jgi:hypothetical protein
MAEEIGDERKAARIWSNCPRHLSTSRARGELTPVASRSAPETPPGSPAGGISVQQPRGVSVQQRRRAIPRCSLRAVSPCTNTAGKPRRGLRAGGRPSNSGPAVTPRSGAARPAAPWSVPTARTRTCAECGTGLRGAPDLTGLRQVRPRPFTRLAPRGAHERTKPPCPQCEAGGARARRACPCGGYARTSSALPAVRSPSASAAASLPRLLFPCSSPWSLACAELPLV